MRRRSFASKGTFAEGEPEAMTRPQVASRSEVARGLRSSVRAGVADAP